MQFQVPQFIEVEDKIFGPLTFKQFVSMAGGGGACYLIWRVLPFYIAAPLMAGVGGLAASLAFLQWNGRPFIQALENGFYFLVRAKLYLWNNKQKAKKKASRYQLPPASSSEVYIPKLSDSKLHELSWSLDIKERIAAGVQHEGEHEGGVISPTRPVRDEVSFGVHTAREARI